MLTETATGKAGKGKAVKKIYKYTLDIWNEGTLLFRDPYNSSMKAAKATLARERKRFPKWTEVHIYLDPIV